MIIVSISDLLYKLESWPNPLRGQLAWKSKKGKNRIDSSLESVVYTPPPAITIVAADSRFKLQIVTVACTGNMHMPS